MPSRDDACGCDHHDQRHFRDALWHSGAPTAVFTAPRPSSDDAGAALSEAEASELAVRLIDVRSEAEFDHLLGAILTHAAARARGALPATLGSVLGGLLKSIARQGLVRRAAGASTGPGARGARPGRTRIRGGSAIRPPGDRSGPAPGGGTCDRTIPLGGPGSIGGRIPRLCAPSAVSLRPMR
jgi:hypothetical protein